MQFSQSITIRLMALLTSVSAVEIKFWSDRSCGASGSWLACLNVASDYCCHQPVPEYAFSGVVYIGGIPGAVGSLYVDTTGLAKCDTLGTRGEANLSICLVSKQGTPGLSGGSWHVYPTKREEREEDGESVCKGVVMVDVIGKVDHDGNEWQLQKTDYHDNEAFAAIVHTFAKLPAEEKHDFLIGHGAVLARRAIGTRSVQPLVIKYA